MSINFPKREAWHRKPGLSLTTAFVLCMTAVKCKFSRLPLPPIDLAYFKKIATGLFHIELRYFDQRCGELGIVIEE